MLVLDKLKPDGKAFSSDYYTLPLKKAPDGAQSAKPASLQSLGARIIE